MSAPAGSGRDSAAGAAGAIAEGPCYVYGVTRSGFDEGALADLEGMGGQGPRLVEHAGLAAIVESVDEASTAGARRGLMAHFEVLNAVSGHAAVLPLRFGTILEGPSDVVTLVLQPQRDELEAALSALSGHVQLVVKARYVQDAVLAEVVADEQQVRELSLRTRGVPEEAAYYQRIRLGELVASAVSAKRVADRDRLLDELVQHAVDWTVRDGSGIDGLADVALLVAVHDVGAVEGVVGRLAEPWAGRVRLQLLGPMAPFDFVLAG